MIHEFTAMATDWWVSSDAPQAHEETESLVREIEARLSRFSPQSALSQLNRARVADDAMLAEVLRVALHLGSVSCGAFDPTLGSELYALGYDRTFEAIHAPTVRFPRNRPAPLLVHVDHSHVALEGVGEVDLGGIAKGWAVDRLVELLERRGATQALVDGGGDIRGFGRAWPIGLPHGDAVELNGKAIATSSTRKRRWRANSGEQLHHVLDPVTGRPTSHSIDTVTVLAADAATADGLATAFVRDTSGRWWTTGSGGDTT